MPASESIEGGRGGLVKGTMGKEQLGGKTNAISSGDNNSHKNCHWIETAANADRTAVCRVDFLCAARKTTATTAATTTTKEQQRKPRTSWASRLAGN